MPGARPRWPLSYGVVLTALGLVFAAVIATDPSDPVTERLDLWWRGTVDDARSDAFDAIAQVLDVAGGPVRYVLVGGIALWLLAARRLWAAAFIVTTAVATMATAQVVKHLVARERPPRTLVDVDFGSFPSGHVVNTITIGLAVAAVVTLHRRTAVFAATAVLTVAMMWARTYLNAHWLSDTVASVLLGGGVTLVLWWLFSPVLERRLRSPSGLGRRTDGASIPR